MNKIITASLFVLIITFLTCSFKFQNSENKFYWAKEKKLTWNDFKAVPDINSTHEAITSSGFNFAPYIIKGASDTVTLIIGAYFIREESWVKGNEKTKYLLNHEQCHFDIDELFSRKFKQQLRSYKFKRISFNDTLMQLISKAQESRTSYQDLYDAETQHSKNKEKQLEWEKKIAKELKDLEAYSNSKITLYLSK